MKPKSKASVYCVGQIRPSQRRKKDRRVVKISVRITEKMAAAKPPGLSWGEYLERLQAKNKKVDITASERTRYAGWAAVSLDRLIGEVSRAIPTSGSEPVGATLNRLAVIANFTTEVANVRRILEGTYGAR
jgi:hypothetical protein